jgi:ankyrin repeat protein
MDINFFYILSGNLKEIKKILKNGANPNTQTNDTSALIYASIYGYEKIVRALIKAGADVDILNKFSLTALHYASRENKIKIVRGLLKANANINIKSTFGNTALIFSSGNGHVKCVKYLLKAGADITLQNDSKYSALLCASEYKQYKVVILLQKVIILVPMLSKRFRRINHDILRESINYF